MSIQSANINWEFGNTIQFCFGSPTPTAPSRANEIQKFAQTNQQNENQVVDEHRHVFDRSNVTVKRKRVRKKRRRRKKKFLNSKLPPAYLREDYQELNPLQDIVVVSQRRDGYSRLRCKAKLAYRKSPVVTVTQQRKNIVKPSSMDIMTTDCSGNVVTILDYFHVNDTAKLAPVPPTSTRVEEDKRKHLNHRRTIEVSQEQNGNACGSSMQRDHHNNNRTEDDQSLLAIPKASFKWNAAVERVKLRARELGLDLGNTDPEVLEWHVNKLKCSKQSSMEFKFQDFVKRNRIEATRNTKDERIEKIMKWVSRHNHEMDEAQKRKLKHECDKQETLMQRIQWRDIQRKQQEERNYKLKVKQVWMKIIVFYKSHQAWQHSMEKLDLYKRQFYLATVIQRNVRRRQAVLLRQKYIWSTNVITRCAYRWVINRRSKRNITAAKVVIAFLQNSQWNFGVIVSRFRVRVTRCQRIVRNYLVCTKARLVALSRMWHKQERVYALELKEAEIAMLQFEILRLVRERNVVNEKHLQKKLGIEGQPSSQTNQHLSNTAENQSGTIDAASRAIVARVGECCEQHDKAHMARIARVTEQANHRFSRAESQYSIGTQFEKAVALTLDDLLLHELYKKLIAIQNSPPTLAPAKRSVRMKSLRELLNQARLKFVKRLEEHREKRQQLEAVKHLVTLEQVKVLVQQWNPALSCKNDALFPAFEVKKPSKYESGFELGDFSVMIYSKISSRDMLSRVKLAYIAQGKFGRESFHS